ncbi:MAG: histidine phosphatase family protein [Proteocatella sp.]
MQSIYLIRHARTNANRTGRLCGKSESELLDSEDVIMNEISNKIEKFTNPVVISSPSMRAQITAKTLGYEVMTNEGLHEFDFGDFEGMTFKEIEDNHPEEFHQICENGINYKYPNGEGLEVFINRVSLAYEDIIKAYGDKDEIVIVSHGGVMQALISYILTKSDALYWNFKIKNCMVVKIYYCEEFPVIEYMK